jgi:hypothetical protein
MSKVPTREQWMAEPYRLPHFAAEALADHELSISQFEQLSGEEILDMILCWQGIIGITTTIVNTIEQLRCNGKGF